MKRFFFSLIALSAAVIGCTQSALLETPDLLSTEVGFNPYTGRTPVTKATEIANANALNADGGFNILCFLNKAGESPRVYLDARVTKAGSVEAETPDSDVIETIYSSSTTQPSLTGAYNGQLPADWTDDKETGTNASIWRAVSEKQPDGTWSNWKISEILTGGYWDYPGTIYWPDSQSSSTLSFVAFSSNVYGPDYAIDTETETDRNDLIEWTKGTNDEDLIKFSVPEAVADQVDFLATSFLDGLSLNNTPSGMVNLYFKHMLSRVGFKLQANQDNNVLITVSDVTLSGTMPTSGTLAIKNTSAPVLTQIAPAEGTTTSYKLMEGWSNFKKQSSKNADQIVNQTSGANIEDCYMMIMPHTSTNDKIHVTYQLQGAEEKQASVDLAGFNFVAGKAYEFVLKVSTSSIEFYVEESDWNNGTVNNSYPLVPGDGTVLRVQMANNSTNAAVTVTEPDDYDEIGMQVKADDGTWQDCGTPIDYNGNSYTFVTEELLPNNLAPNTTYYVRAYAQKNAESAGAEDERYYSSEKVALTTLPKLGGISATQISGRSATLNCSLPGNGKARVTVGFRYCKEDEDITSAQMIKAELTNGSFSLVVNSLEPATKYLYQAYATNAAGTVITETPGTFTTIPVAPAVRTDDATNIGVNSATLNGTLTYNGGGATVSDVYFKYSTTKDGDKLTGDITTTTQQLNASDKNFDANIVGLTRYTRYYVQAFAKNSVSDEIPGEIKSFITQAEAPIISTTSITYSSSSATFTMNVDDDGGAPIESVRFSYKIAGDTNYSSNNATPTISGDSISATLADLTAGKLYYVKVYVINKGGKEGDSTEVTFTTPISDQPIPDWEEGTGGGSIDDPSYKPTNN